MYPSVKCNTKVLISSIIAVQELFWHFHCLKAHNYCLDLTTEKLPEGRNTVRVNYRYIQKRMKLFAQHIQRQRHAAGFRKQKMFVRRLLSGVPCSGKACPFQKIHYAGRSMRKLLASL